MSRASGLKAVAVVLVRLINSPATRSDHPGVVVEDFLIAATMNDKPKLRDTFFSTSPSVKEAEASASQSNEPPQKANMGQILEDGFKAEMKGCKTGCLILWHIGTTLILLFILIVALGTIYHVIFG